MSVAARLAIVALRPMAQGACREVGVEPGDAAVAPAGDLLLQRFREHHVGLVSRAQLCAGARLENDRDCAAGRRLVARADRARRPASRRAAQAVHQVQRSGRGEARNDQPAGPGGTAGRAEEWAAGPRPGVGRGVGEDVGDLCEVCRRRGAVQGRSLGHFANSRRIKSGRPDESRRVDRSRR